MATRVRERALPGGSAAFDAGTSTSFLANARGQELPRDRAINVSSLNSGDVAVNGPDSFNARPELVGVDVDVASNGTPRIAPGSFVPRGGSCGVSHHGSSSISVLANQVSNMLGSLGPATTMGSFSVSILLPDVVSQHGLENWRNGLPMTGRVCAAPSRATATAPLSRGAAPSASACRCMQPGWADPLPAAKDHRLPNPRKAYSGARWNPHTLHRANPTDMQVARRTLVCRGPGCGIRAGRSEHCHCLRRAGSTLPVLHPHSIADLGGSAP